MPAAEGMLETSAPGLREERLLPRDRNGGGNPRVDASEFTARRWSTADARRWALIRPDSLRYYKSRGVRNLIRQRQLVICSSYKGVH